jgi:hypothetical protein
MRLVATLLLFALPLAAAAQLQLRTIPQDAARGQLRHVQAMHMSLDGKKEELAPGAQIRDANNRVVVPSMLTAETLVKYRRNPEGRLHQIWILTPEEAAAKDEAKK